MTSYDWSNYEPPEYYQAYVEVLTKDARSAIVQAVKTDEFSEWVLEARGDGMPPFKGLKAWRTLCQHGVCWACLSDDALCSQCELAFNEMESLEAVKG